MAASEGEATPLSSMKSPRCELSSSPMGVSSEIGCCAIFFTLRTLSTGISRRLGEFFRSGLAAEFLHHFAGWRVSSC